MSDTRSCVTCVHWTADRLCIVRNKHYSLGLDNCPLWMSKIGPQLGVSQYEELGSSIGKLVSEKQQAYGDSFGKAGKILAILYPEGIPLAKLDDALTVVRVVDKLFRIATDKDALGESPWRDICGYALLSVAREEKPLLGTRNSNGEKVERDIVESMKEGK